MKKTDALIILDGYGLVDEVKGNAIKAANTPYLDYLFDTYPHSILSAIGLDVGLPKGQIGNSEVGHLNIGAGRIVFQDMTAIDKAIEDGSFFTNPAFLEAMENAKKSSLHLCGLCSNGGVHSHLNHLYALLKMAKNHNIKNVFIHCITDGRDTPPTSAGDYIKQIEDKCIEIGIGKIATIVGRYYIMDRDNRWERVEKGYSCVFAGIGKTFTSPQEAIKESYNSGLTDEFFMPMVEKDYKGFEKGSSFIFFNFRADRARHITSAAISPEFDKFQRIGGFLSPLYVGMTEYDAKFTGLLTAFPPKDLPMTLGEYLSKLGKTQARIAETEKYAHVTFFFNGGVEKPNPGEERYLIPSPKVATYDLKPEMSAEQVADKAVEVAGRVDLIILNFANLDMVGHTGNYNAAIKATEFVDKELKKVIEAVLKTGGSAIIAADHGNAEKMFLPDGSPMTSHTDSLVPIILVGENYKDIKLKDGKLCDIAPTLLEIMELEKPKEMTGTSLIVK